MICPIKNKAWDKLEGEYGVDAYAVHRMEGVPTRTSFDEGSPVFQQIFNIVSSNPDYYANKYAKYLAGKVRDTSVLDMTRAFYYRVEGKEGIELFPATDVEFKQKAPTRNLMNTVLEDLKRRFNIDFTIIDDAAITFKGKYVNVGGEKQVIVNVANATLDTPFHEYYHPFVRLIKNENPELYRSLLEQAGVTDEEALTQQLGEMAASKYPTSLLARVLAAINRILRRLTGRNYELTGSSTIEEVVQYLMNENIDVVRENTLMTAYQASKIFAGATKIEKEKFVQDVIEILRKASQDVKTNDDTSYYLDLAGNEIAKRLTAFVGDKVEGEFSIRLRDKPSTYSELLARKLYAENKISESASINYGGKEMTFAEVVDRIEADTSINRLYGKAGHAYFQYLVETDPTRKAEANATRKLYEEKMEEAGKSARDLGVIQKDLTELLNLIGMETGDRLASELAIISEELTSKDGSKLGTTADGVIQHGNGEVTLFDLKFGNITNDMYTGRMMEYAKGLGIKDSKLSRAYLELAFRAMMVKEKFPDVKFRSVKLIRVDTNNSNHKAMELDLGLYLELISNYYRATNPTLHASLEEKGMFDVLKYQGEAAVVNKYNKTMEGWSLPTKLEYVENKLKALTLYSNVRATDDSFIKSERAVLAKLFQELSKSPEANLSRHTDDISGLLGNFKNMSEVEHPQVQQWHKHIQTVRGKMKKEFDEISKQEQALFKDVIMEAAPDNEARNRIKTWTNLALAGTIIAAGFGATPFLIGVPMVAQLVMYRYGQVPKDLFGFMWRKDDGVSKGFYLNLQNTYTDKNGNEVPLTAAQIKYREFILTTMHEKYKTLMATKAFNSSTGKEQTYAQVLEMPPELPIDFLPRIPKSSDELRLEQDFAEGFFGLKTRIKDFTRDHFTQYFEDNFENTKDVGGLPMRYFHKPGSTTIEEVNHSFNVSQAFNMFMGSMLNKEYYDPLMAISYGVRDSIELTKDESGRQKYPNLVKWMDQEIMLQVTKDLPKDRLTTKEVTITVGKWGAPILGMPVGTQLVFNQDRLLGALKSSVSFAIMSFKIVGPIFNTAIVTMTNAMSESKAAIGSILGIPPEYVHAKFGTTAGAYKDFAAYVKGEMDGKGSKIAKLAEKFDWIATSYDYVSDPKALMYDVTSPGLFNHAFMFHNAAETWASFVQLSMLMRSTTVENAKGEKFTLWDAYDNDGNWTKGERGSVVVGDSTIKLEGLDEREIKALKRQNEKTHGAYRYEEKAAIEATIFGQFLLQFKKYFFTFLKNLYASPYQDITVGRYVIDKDLTKPEGMPVWKWESEIMQGRLRVLASAVMGADKFKDYIGPLENATKEQRFRQVRMLELFNTLLWVTMLTITIGAAFDDEEKNSYAFKRMERLRDDMSQGALPKDLFAAIQQPVVAADKVAKTGKAFFEWIAFDYNKDGTQKGAAELVKNIPVGNNFKQIQDMFFTASADQTNLFGTIPKAQR